MLTIKQKAEKWLTSSNVDNELKIEIKEANSNELNDMFFKDLEFGTGGMRGLLGPGSNRMNVFTVRKVTLAFATFLLNTYGERARKQGVILSHDNRFHSREFVLEISKEFNELGFNTFVFDSLRTTPELSFGVRYKKCIAGVMITASHNPKEYNGYKIYDETGCQFVPNAIQPMLDIVSTLGDELDLTYDKASVFGKQNLLDNTVDDAFMKEVHSIAIYPEDKKVAKVVFTPQHGTAAVLGRRLFKELGYDMTPVLSQCNPDPAFSNTLSPNPELKEAYVAAIKLAKEKKADLILTTDPDGDRVGLGFLNTKGEYELLTGNQTGALLIDYVLKNRKKIGTLSNNPLLCDTIVTSQLGRKIAHKYGVRTESYLTGFKYIGEAMNKYEKSGEYTVEFGYEESYGYIFKGFVRDKDALQALLMISEMTNHYLLEGKKLDQKLEELYKEYGYHMCTLKNIYFKGESGLKDMANILNEFRENPFDELAGVKVVKLEDYMKQVSRQDGKETELKGFPKSNVLKFFLEDGSWLAMRPSGTEPKCKFYYEAIDTDEDVALAKLDKFHEAILKKADL